MLRMTQVSPLAVWPNLPHVVTPGLQVWKIEDFLAKWTKATEGKGTDDPIALILLKEIDAYKWVQRGPLQSCAYEFRDFRAGGWDR